MDSLTCTSRHQTSRLSQLNDVHVKTVLFVVFFTHIATVSSSSSRFLPSALRLPQPMIGCLRLWLRVLKVGPSQVLRPNERHHPSEGTCLTAARSWSPFSITLTTSPSITTTRRRQNTIYSAVAFEFAQTTRQY